MNENIDLMKILKDCPEGTTFYTPVWGEVSFVEILEHNGVYSFRFDTAIGSLALTKEGCFLDKDYDTECIIFPSKDQRDWSKFAAPWYKKGRFDPKTLNPFDKILVQRYDDVWMANFLSYFYTVINPDNPDIRHLEFITITNGDYIHCIPYNDDTKHLVGTTEEAPEYYRYWED